MSEMRGVVDGQLLDEVEAAAEPLRGATVVYVNSNQNRGGVFEHLSSLVPLMNDLGVHARWLAASRVPAEFYEATRLLYNGLQGDAEAPEQAHWRIYDEVNELAAAQVVDLGADVVLVQDHQFAGARARTDSRQRWIWQSHSDTSAPNQQVLEAFSTYLQPYDGFIFYCPEYVFGVPGSAAVMHSTIAIDPVSEKNRDMSRMEAQRRMARFGFDPRRPLIAQVSRVDRWKDFPGVVEAWLQARQEVNDLQLALIGSVTANNTLAEAIIAETDRLLQGAADARMLVNQVHGRDIKAFQVAADAVIQNSRREGFGLTVSEALWSRTPVVGRDVTGIRLQVVDGECGFLVTSAAECAERVCALLQDPGTAEQMGRYGRARVRQQFLLPRLMRDELRLMGSVLGTMARSA
jgi:trehalose synthase